MVGAMTEIKTTSKAVLRRMLRDCDRQLSWFDQVGRKYSFVSHTESMRFLSLDAKRRAIREKLKERKA